MTLSSQRTLHAILVVLAVGVALRFWQWYARTSMWLDEIWLAQNFRDRGLGELLATPLSSGKPR